ncbi:MAG: phospho-N-acetylmuramoyl-pentapeptide-transferase [Clostridia bacterium]|nr:phospho-N-acetylmuramoyl-pentapeptide-transferase [Clostridia bacterium]
MEFDIRFVIAFVLSLGTAALLLKIFIPVLVKVKLGQKILEIGPSWHMSKQGTPVMGGLFFIAAILLSCCIFALPDAISSGNYRLVIHFSLALMYGAVGFIDDYVKLFKKTNKGLSAPQKMVLQIAVTVVYLWLLNHLGYLDTCIAIPFTGKSIDFGIFYYVIAALVIIYLTNCANLTDGIDGLAASVAAVICVLLSALAVYFNYYEMMILSLSCIGALIGFLFFNFHPAKIFMGDTGSQFLGGIVVAMSVWINAGVVIFLIMMIYLIEGISVILQVASFKLTGKRIFKMAPIHHHFEMCGWSEVKIVGVFTLVTAVCCAGAYFMLTLA